MKAPGDAYNYSFLHIGDNDYEGWFCCKVAENSDVEVLWECPANSKPIRVSRTIAGKIVVIFEFLGEASEGQPQAFKKVRGDYCKARDDGSCYSGQIQQISYFPVVERSVILNEGEDSITYYVNELGEIINTSDSDDVIGSVDVETGIIELTPAFMDNNYGEF